MGKTKYKSRTIYVVRAQYYEDSWSVGARTNKRLAEKLREKVMACPSDFIKYEMTPHTAYIEETTLLEESFI